MGLTEFDIVFDNQWKTYYAGQTVSGHVELVLDSPKRVRGIVIRFKGAANVEWYDTETQTNNEGKQQNDTVSFQGSEEYFKTEYYLMGGSGSAEIDLPVGRQQLPFTCVLPPALPSSFEGSKGHIRYTVKVIIDRPWKFDHETKTAFTVLSPVDLNLNPTLKNPVRITLEKFYCCCWCKSGPLTCIISIPYSGYVPGQTIPIVAEVDNISNVEVLNVKFVLQKVVTFYSQIPRRESYKTTNILEKIQVGPVGPHDSRTWSQNLLVPPLPPSNLTNCSLIDIDYEITFEVMTPAFHTNSSTTIPITIGTVPLVLQTAPNAPPVETGSFEANSENNGIIGWANPSIPSVFTESQFGTSNIQDKGDNQYTRFSNNKQNYSPSYPVYNFGTNPPQ